MSDCSICIEAFSSLEDLSILPCGHCFHRTCIDKWSRTPQIAGPSCPICHGKFRPEPPRGVLKKIFMPGMQLVKIESLVNVSKERDEAIEKRKQAVQEAKQADARVNAMQKEFDNERFRSEARDEFMRVTEERNRKMTTRLLEMDQKLAAERESKKNEILIRENAVRHLVEELKLKEAEVEVAECEIRELKRSLDAQMLEVAKEEEKRKMLEESLWLADKRCEDQMRVVEAKEEECQKREDAIVQKEEEHLRREEELKSKEEEQAVAMEALAQEKQSLEEERKEMNEEEMRLRAQLAETEIRCEDLTDELRTLREPLSLIIDQMDDFVGNVDQLQHHLLDRIEGRDIDEPVSPTSSVCDLAIVDEVSPDQNIDVASIVGLLEEDMMAATAVMFDNFDGPEDHEDDVPLCHVENLRVRDAAFIEQMGLELMADFDKEQAPREPTDDSALLDRLDAICGSSLLSASDLDSLVRILAAVFETPHFNFFVRAVLDESNEIFSTCVDMLADQVQVPVVDPAHAEERVGILCSALKLMAYLMLGRAGDVDKMMRQFDLVEIIYQHLRNGVERTQVLSLTVLRVAVCRPALRCDGPSSFPSVALLRSLLQGSKALGVAASKLVSDGAKCGKVNKSVLASLSKHDFFQDLS